MENYFLIGEARLSLGSENFTSLLARATGHISGPGLHECQTVSERILKLLVTKILFP